MKRILNGIKPMLMVAALLLPVMHFKASAQIFADVNCDGIADPSDISSLIDYLLNDTGRSISTSNGYLSARDYGAVGDGVTDDTPALELLFEDAAKFDKAVYFPAGTYLIRRSLKLKSGMEIYGDGESSIIKKQPAVWHQLRASISNGASVASLDDISGYKVGDQFFITYSTSINYPSARNCSNGIITAIDSVNKTITFASCYPGIKNGAIRTQASGSYVSTSFAVLRSWSCFDECINVYIHDICIDGNRQQGEPMEWSNGCIHFDAFGSTMCGIPYDHHSYGHFVQRCKVINSSFDGISDQGEGNLFVKDCVIENSAMHGVHMGTDFSNAVIADNTMTGNGQLGAGVFCCQNVVNVVVSGNSITAFNHGVSDEEYGTRGMYLIIRNNRFSDMTSYVFDFLKASSTSRGGGLQIMGNTISGLKASLFYGNYLDNVIFTDNQVTSANKSLTYLISVNYSNNVIVSGNTLPAGASVSTMVRSTSTTNLINNGNSWN